MKWKLNPPEYWRSVYYFVKFIGLAPFSIKDNRFHPPSSLGILYPVLCASSYSLILTKIFLLTIGKITVGNSAPLMEFLTLVLYLTSLATTCLTLIIFLLMYKKIMYLMNKLCIVSDEFKNQNIEEDYTKFFKNLLMTVVIANSVFVALCVIVCLLEPAWHILLLIKYTVDSWFSFNMVLAFAQVLIYIKQRFLLLNEKLHDVFTPFGRHVLPHHTRISVVSRNDREENQPGSERLTDHQRIRMIKALHLELCDLVKRTTDIFAVPILCNSVRVFFQLMLSPYWIYFVLQDSSHSRNAAIFCFALRMAITIVLLFIVAYASQTTCEQGNATRAVLSKSWIKIRTVEVQKEYLMVSLQLIDTPVTVSAFGFIDLGYSFVFNMFCAVATYFIVMIQLDV